MVFFLCLRFNTPFLHKFCYKINKVSDTTKKGRETGVRTEYPSRDLTPLYNGFPGKNGRM